MLVPLLNGIVDAIVLDGWIVFVTVFGPCMILLNLILCAIQLNRPRELLPIMNEICTTMPPLLIVHLPYTASSQSLSTLTSALLTFHSFAQRRAHNCYRPLDFATQLSQNRLVTRILPHGNFKTSEARMPTVSRNMLKVLEVMCRMLLFVLEATDGVRYVLKLLEVIRCALLVLEVMHYMLEMLEDVSCVQFCMLKAVEGVLYVIEAPKVMRCVLPLWNVGSHGRRTPCAETVGGDALWAYAMCWSYLRRCAVCCSGCCMSLSAYSYGYVLDAFEVMCCVLLSYAGGHGGRMPYAGVARGKEPHAVEGVCPSERRPEMFCAIVIRSAGAMRREPR